MLSGWKISLSHERERSEQLFLTTPFRVGKLRKSLPQEAAITGQQIQTTTITTETQSRVILRSPFALLPPFNSVRVRRFRTDLYLCASIARIAPHALVYSRLETQDDDDSTANKKIRTETTM